MTTQDQPFEILIDGEPLSDDNASSGSDLEVVLMRSPSRPDEEEQRSRSSYPVTLNLFEVPKETDQFDGNLHLRHTPLGHLPTLRAYHQRYIHTAIKQGYNYGILATHPGGFSVGDIMWYSEGEPIEQVSIDQAKLLALEHLGLTPRQARNFDVMLSAYPSGFEFAFGPGDYSIRVLSSGRLISDKGPIEQLAELQAYNYRPSVLEIADELIAGVQKSIKEFMPDYLSMAAGMWFCMTFLPLAERGDLHMDHSSSHEINETSAEFGCLTGIGLYTATMFAAGLLIHPALGLYPVATNLASFLYVKATDAREEIRYRRQSQHAKENVQN